MMQLHTLLAKQGVLEKTYADFLSSLDPDITVTLRQLLTDPAQSLKQLGAPWIDVNILVQRFSALEAFFIQLGNHARLRDETRLIFFQSASPERDAEAHEYLKESRYYKERFGHLSSAAFHHLHTFTKWMPLTGSWEEGRRKLWPLGNYATFESSDVLPHGAHTVEEDERHRKAALGYAVVNWPTELGIGNDVATDYFVRPIIHDIGHGKLPILNPSIDSLHNAVMLYATKAGVYDHDSLWETMVHRECTDPYFYVYGGQLLTTCEELELTAVQRHYLESLKVWYQSKGHERNKTWLWGITSEMDTSAALQQMELVLGEMCTDGFLRYNLKT